jgi:phosphoesterase RecJ-like protein
MDNAPLAAIAEQLQKAQRLIVVSHIHPDGDALGSLLGFGLALQEAGKQVTMVSADGVPANYKFLAGTDRIVTSPRGDFDAIIAVDCSDFSRLGNALVGYRLPDVNIDHHVTNEKFARINLIDTQAVATSEILAVLLPSAGFSLTQPAARALLTGMVTDTLGFRTSNMTPKALRVAANLLEFGIDLPEIFQNTLMQRSFEAIRYWGAGLNRLERIGGLAWTSLTLEDRKAVGYPGRDDADLINVLSSITDVDIAIIFTEQVRDRIKVSWRARPGLDVSRIALSFGGGGHPAAAGAEIHGALPDVRERVLKATQMIEK